MKIKVTKASGRTEDLDTGKLLESLLRAGADREQAGVIIDNILGEIPRYTNTRKIYSLAMKYLRQINHATGLRYSLKRAIFRLGPSGYPFEKYVGELFRHHGYRTENGLVLEGRCVKHEVDVLASNEGELSFIECKYHNRAGNSTDVKVAMYIHARFQDLGPLFREKYPAKEIKGWLVTNTRCTSDALKYAECTGLNILSWTYPGRTSLQKMIEDKKLYPVTIMAGVSSGLLTRLFERNIILLKTLAEMEAKEIGSLLSVPENKATSLKKQADALCLC